MPSECSPNACLLLLTPYLTFTCLFVDPITFDIIIDNTTPDDVTGEITYEDNTTQEYSVDASNSEEITHNDASFVTSVTGQIANGLVCTPYVKSDNEDPKQKFIIVIVGDGCRILAADEQYHSIGQTTWYENGELVTQEDYFNPGTREAVLKTGAHGDRLNSTTIFQARESTNSRRSTGFGLMVTASKHECHVNHLNDDLGIKLISLKKGDVFIYLFILILGINPEHMTIPKDQSSGRKRQRKNKKKRRSYVGNLVTEKTVISPDDDTVKLTETMKKECEGRTIFYHKEHLLESGEEFKFGVRNLTNKNRQTFETMLSQNYRNLARQVKNSCPPADIQVILRITKNFNIFVF